MPAKLTFKFKTGDDDLRSDSLLAALIIFENGAPQLSALHPKDAPGWANRSYSEVDVELQRPALITRIVLLFNQGGGPINGDNWNMESLEVLADGRQVFSQVGGSSESKCVHRFKGSFENIHDSQAYEFQPSR